MGRAGRLLRAPGGSGFGACPVCGRDLPLARLPAHVEKCLLEGSRDGGGDGGGVKRRLREEECRQGHFGRRTAARLAGADAAGPRRGAGGGGGGGYPVVWAPDDSDGAEDGGLEGLDPRDVGGPPGAVRVAERDEALEGLYVVEDFVSANEEERILDLLDADSGWNPWRRSSFNGAHVGKAWGVKSELKARRVVPARHAVPSWAQGLSRRMRRLGRSLAGSPLECMAQFRPNDCNAIEYVRAKGHWLKAHCDDRHLSGDVLVTLSLAGNCNMEFELTRGGSGRSQKEVAFVPLPRRSLLVQAGGVRYTHTHGIPNRCLASPRRVSVTFRETSDGLGEARAELGGRQTKISDAFANVQ